MGLALALLDFSKAFDRVWKEDLLLRASPSLTPNGYVTSSQTGGLGYKLTVDVAVVR